MPLRTRLLVTLIVVVSLGLIGSDIATYAALRSFLIGRIQPQLDLASFSVSRAVLSSDGLIPTVPGFPRLSGSPPKITPSGHGFFPGHAPLPVGLRRFAFAPTRTGELIPTGTIGELVNAAGHPVAKPISFNFGTKATRGLTLPRPLPNTSKVNEVVFDANSTGHNPTAYRVLERPLGYHGLAVVVAIPLTEVSQTLGHLLLIEVLATAAILLTFGLLSRWVVRRGLRPLENMAATAGYIAQGDLSRRVDSETGRTEVDQLGSALNSMLSEIQGAFDSRAASEARLRRFVADASHELRTPLTSLRGYAELFEHNESPPPKDLSTAMGHIRREAERMNVLVDDLLILASLDQVRPLHPARENIVSLVQDAVSSLGFASPEHAVVFEHPDEVFIECDAERMRRAVDNLLTNASRYSPPGTDIHVTLAEYPPTEDPPEDSGVEIKISDQGPGVRAEEASRIFEPFYRSDSSRTRNTGGTGLGLAIVAAIVEAHGGSFGVTQNGSTGSCFWIRVPSSLSLDHRSQAG